MDGATIDQVHDFDAPPHDELSSETDELSSETDEVSGTVEHWDMNFGRRRLYLDDIDCPRCDGERTSAITDAVACGVCGGVGLEPFDRDEKP